MYCTCLPLETLNTKVLEDESAEVEARRKALQEAQEVGKQQLEAGREEMRLAAERLETEKGEIQAAWKVREDPLPSAPGAA